MNDTQTSSTGLSVEFASLLCYLPFWLGGLVLLLLEQDSKLVRFHALQSLFFFLGLVVISWLAPSLPLIGGLIAWLCKVIWWLGWVWLMIKAYNGEEYKMPLVGQLAQDRC